MFMNDPKFITRFEDMLRETDPGFSLENITEFAAYLHRFGANANDMFAIAQNYHVISNFIMTARQYCLKRDEQLVLEYARETGIAMIGTREAARLYQYILNEWGENAMYEVPFSLHQLYELKDSHQLVAIFPYALSNIYSRIKSFIDFKRFQYGGAYRHYNEKIKDGIIREPRQESHWVLTTVKPQWVTKEELETNKGRLLDAHSVLYIILSRRLLEMIEWEIDVDDKRKNLLPYEVYAPIYLGRKKTAFVSLTLSYPEAESIQIDVYSYGKPDAYFERYEKMPVFLAEPSRGEVNLAACEKAENEKLKRALKFDKTP